MKPSLHRSVVFLSIVWLWLVAADAAAQSNYEHEDGLLIRHRGGRFTAYGGEDGLPHTEALRIDEDVERNLWITWNTGIVTKFGPHPVRQLRACRSRPTGGS